MQVSYTYMRSLLLCFFLMNCCYGYAQEICNNGKDDDGNGLTDLYDPACQCHFTVTGNLLLNGSFELHDHCPVYHTYDEDYRIADNWEYGTYTNVGEAIFYHNLTCTNDSAQFMLQMPPVLPLPDGHAFISIQNNTYITPIPEPQIPKSYVGQCLPSSLKKGINYTLSFYAGRFRAWDNLTGKIYPFTVALFGNADCNAVPFGKKYALGNGCPANYSGWMLLGETTMYSSGAWVQGKINFTVPYDINVIEIGPDCGVLPPINDQTDSTTFYDYYNYYLDDLHLLPTKDFPFEYIQVKTGSDCKDFPLLQAPIFPNAKYQWYKDSVAIQGATLDTYKITDVSGIHYYNVLITTTDKCITSEPYLITSSKLGDIQIPADTGICINDTLLLSPAILGITYNVNGLISNEVRINTPGSYTITATDVNGCERMFNTIITQQNCTDCNMYVPAAFTPNGDGLNEVFKPKLNCYASVFHCRIYDRWGRQIFETSDLNKGWDGTYTGNKIQQGTYVYYIDYKTVRGITKTARGTVVLIR